MAGLGWSKGQGFESCRGTRSPNLPHELGLPFCWFGVDLDCVIESNEINFCDDDDVIDRLPHWIRGREEAIDFQSNDIQAYVPMYYI